MRRGIALTIDLVVPWIPSGVTAAILWAWWRPDRIDGTAALGAGFVILAVAFLAWSVALIANDVVLAARGDRTLGERLCGFELELPTGLASRVRRLSVRAALRTVVVVLAASAFGLSTEHLGEGVVGLATGLAATGLLVVGVTRVGARGATTALDRVSRVEVRVRARPGRR